MHRKSLCFTHNKASRWRVGASEIKISCLQHNVQMQSFERIVVEKCAECVTLANRSSSAIDWSVLAANHTMLCSKWKWSKLTDRIGFVLFISFFLHSWIVPIFHYIKQSRVARTHTKHSIRISSNSVNCVWMFMHEWNWKSINDKLSVES